MEGINVLPLRFDAFAETIKIILSPIQYAKRKAYALLLHLHQIFYSF